MGEIDPRFKECVSLRNSGSSIREISDCLGIPKSTVANWLSAKQPKKKENTSKERDEIKRAVINLGANAKAKQIHALSGREAYGSTRTLLYKMVKSGDLNLEYDVYSLPTSAFAGKIETNAPWAKTLRQNSEAAGHAMAARILELAEPSITRAIRDATWQAMQEILEADRAAA